MGNLNPIKIESFNPANLRLLRQLLEKHLAAVEAEVGVKVVVGGARYSDSTVTFKVDLNIVAENGVVHDRYRDEYTQLARIYGLDPEWIDREFTDRTGTKFRISGLNTRKRKFPVIVARVTDGKKFLYNIDTIRFALEGRAK